MALKVELKPGEKIIIGTVALRNGDSRNPPIRRRNSSISLSS
jgi:flagellar biosynthesis regulator FlbT